MPGLDGVGVDRRQEGHGGDDHGQPDDVGPAVQAEGGLLGLVRLEVGRLLVAVGPPLDAVVGDEQQRVDEEPLGGEREGPGEGDAAQHPEEQRRVAERGEQAAAVGDDEDREDHRVDLVATLGVGVEQRADQEHRGAGGADEARQDPADGQERGVVAGRRADVTGEEEPARDDEQRQQQGDELGVLQQGVPHERVLAGAAYFPAVNELVAAAPGRARARPPPAPWVAPSGAPSRGAAAAPRWTAASSRRG